MKRPSFSLGIEEEYLIVDRESRDLVAAPVGAFFADCQDALGDQVSAELLRCQIEVGTKPHATVAGALEDLRNLRATLARMAARHGYAVIAASTHPFADWRAQTHTPKPRYAEIWSEIGQPANRMMICGMHIHLGIEDPDLRIDLMNQIAYFLPHLLALSASSPFWEGRDTSLASYRLTVLDALPRSGFPDALASYSEYRALVDHLVETGCVPDATKIWWDIRPSDRFPTLEQRITDVCPRIEDVAAIAALFQALAAYLYRLRRANQSWRLYPRTLLLENRWRAQRHGSAAELIDHGRRRAFDLGALVGELIELVGPDAAELGCADELAGLRRVVAKGTSATRQRRVHAAALEEGRDEAGALRAVVDDLIASFKA